LRAPGLPQLPDVATLGGAYDLVYGAATSTGGPQQFAPHNPRRVGLLVWGAVGLNRAFVAPEGLDPTTLGVQLEPNGWFEILWLRHGPLVQQAWFWDNIGSGVQLVWIEIILRGW
jgi:hypothetical protein